MIVNRDCWERFKSLLRYLRPWVDPSSYRALWALVVVSLGVFLAPLAFDICHAIFFRLPPWFRNALGNGVLMALGAYGLRRLWRVNPGDSWPGFTYSVPVLSHWRGCCVRAPCRVSPCRHGIHGKSLTRKGRKS
jgi:hypothetical protein